MAELWAGCTGICGVRQAPQRHVATSLTVTAWPLPQDLLHFLFLSSFPPSFSIENGVIFPSCVCFNGNVESLGVIMLSPFFLSSFLIQINVVTFPLLNFSSVKVDHFSLVLCSVEKWNLRFFQWKSGVIFSHFSVLPLFYRKMESFFAILHFLNGNLEWLFLSLLWRVFFSLRLVL